MFFLDSASWANLVKDVRSQEFRLSSLESGWKIKCRSQNSE